ncbi:MAG TPA: hypothetical protein EYN66_04615 [Myxococcales bacterium]|nr:hypothetical protein [Myxococcales bacterium]
MSSATKKADRKPESRRSKRGAESHSLQSRVERALTELTNIGRIIARRQGADGGEQEGDGEGAPSGEGDLVCVRGWAEGAGHGWAGFYTVENAG